MRCPSADISCDPWCELSRLRRGRTTAIREGELASQPDLRRGGPGWCIRRLVGSDRARELEAIQIAAVVCAAVRSLSTGTAPPSPSHPSICRRAEGGRRPRTRLRSSLATVTINTTARNPSKRRFMIFPLQKLAPTAGGGRLVRECYPGDHRAQQTGATPA